MRRPQKKKNKPVRTIGAIFGWLIFLITGLLIIGAYLAFTHPLFNIEYITISGNVKNSNEKILESSSFKKGENIFSAKVKESEESILQLPDIEKVSIQKKIPNRIHIDITENYNFAYFDSGNKSYIISGKSEVFPYTDEDKDTMIHLLGVTIEDISDRRTLPENNYLRTLNQGIVSEDLYSFIKEIDVSNQTNMKIILKNNTIVEIGDQSNIFNKMEVLRRLLEQISTNNIKSEKIIINNNQKPIILPIQNSENNDNIVQ